MNVADVFVVLEPAVILRHEVGRSSQTFEALKIRDLDSHGTAVLQGTHLENAVGILLAHKTNFVGPLGKVGRIIRHIDFNSHDRGSNFP